MQIAQTTKRLKSW